jgi:hypothetical protein
MNKPNSLWIPDTNIWNEDQKSYYSRKDNSQLENQSHQPSSSIIFINRWLGIYEKFEDIKQVIRSHQSTGQAIRTPLKTGLNSLVTEGLKVPVPHVTPVV